MHALNPNRWYHLAGTYDGMYRRLYVDGELWGSVEQAGLIHYQSCVLALGGSEGCTRQLFFPNNYLAEVRLWNFAQSQDELVGLKGVRISPSTSGLLGLWRSVDATGMIPFPPLPPTEKMRRKGKKRKKN